MLHSRAADLKAVACGVFPLRERVDDHVDTSALNHLDDVRAALMHLAHNLHVNSEGSDRLRRALRRHNIKVELGECLGKLLELLLVLIRNGKEEPFVGMFSPEPTIAL